jgi:uncharacterized protein YigE (DUF2233 family)
MKYVLALLGVLFFVGGGSAASSPQEIISANTPAIVYLEVTDDKGNFMDSGSGFIVSHDGYVITVAHLKPGPGQRLWATIGQREGTRYPLSLREVDEDSDVALWQLPQAAVCRPAVAISTTPVKVLDRVLVLGFPGKDGLTPSSVGINNLSTPEHGFYKADGFLRPGNSGGPAFNDVGRAVAIVQGGTMPGTDNNDLVPISLAVALIKKRNVQAGIDAALPCPLSQVLATNDEPASERAETEQAADLDAQGNGLQVLVQDSAIQIAHFTNDSDDSVVVWLRNKFERNLAKYLATLGVKIRADGLASPSLAPAHYVIQGGVEAQRNGQASQDVSIFFRCVKDGIITASSSIDGPAQDMKEVYESLPQAALYAMNMVAGVSGLHEDTSPRITRQPLAYALWVEAHRRAAMENEAEAIRLLQRAVTVDPHFATGYFNLSELKAKIGDQGDAQIALERAAALNADYPRISILHSSINPLPTLRAAMIRSAWREAKPGLVFKEAHDMAFGNTLIAVKAIDGRYRLSVGVAEDVHGSTAEELRERKAAAAAINGGFFDRDDDNRLSPSGLLTVDSHVLAPLSDTGGSGVLSIDGDSLSIIPSANSAAFGASKYAIQAGPRLVENGSHNGIYRNDKNRLERASVCLTSEGPILVVVKGTGVSLYEMAELLASPEGSGGLNCLTALNLDGGPSTQLSLMAGDHDIEQPGLWKINNALLFAPSSGTGD